MEFQVTPAQARRELHRTGHQSDDTAECMGDEELAVGDNLQTVGVIHRVVGGQKDFRSDKDKERSETKGDPESGLESGTAGTGREQSGRSHDSDGTSEDLKINFHFILHFDDSSTNTDGLDSKISLFENGVCRVGLAGLFHGQTERFAHTV